MEEDSCNKTSIQLSRVTTTTTTTRYKEQPVVVFIEAIRKFARLMKRSVCYVAEQKAREKEKVSGHII